MAEAFARMDGEGRVEAYSAGSEASGVVNPRAIEVLGELGYDMAAHRSKTPEEVPGGPFDVVVSMGCGDRCPAVPTARREDWDIPDPKDMSLDDFRNVRNLIRSRVLALLGSL
jgi:protein-tyrosine-phosphatase